MIKVWYLEGQETKRSLFLKRIFGEKIKKSELRYPTLPTPYMYNFPIDTVERFYFSKCLEPSDYKFISIT